mmetsp:Transcript_9123/g.11356  ORF Transcript_9123/g.11356 Transcript_9123/m.11356 type:complete len:123 (-) Transcript_9123:132-500(-)
MNFKGVCDICIWDSSNETPRAADILRAISFSVLPPPFVTNKCGIPEFWRISIPSAALGMAVLPRSKTPSTSITKAKSIEELLDECFLILVILYSSFLMSAQNRRNNNKNKTNIHFNLNQHIT